MKKIYKAHQKLILFFREKPEVLKTGHLPIIWDYTDLTKVQKIYKKI